MTAPRIALIGGQGWPLTETQAGLPTLAKRLAELGVDTKTFSHADRQGISSFLASVGGFRGLVGDSLGAGAAAMYAADVKGPVDFVGGFQPSAWDPIGQGPITARVIMVARNVKVAHCIWDPVFVETGGLGNAHYVVHPGKTALTTTEHHGMHPDDWGYAQDLMVNHISQLLIAAGAGYGAKQ
jgi:hypothetical protein